MAFVLRLNDTDDRRLAIACAHLGTTKTDFVRSAIGVAIAADDELSRMLEINDAMRAARENAPKVPA